MVNAVITLLYCEEVEAMEIWKNAGGRAVKPAPASASVAATPVKSKPGPKSKTQSVPGPSSSAAPPVGPRSAKRSSYVNYDDTDDDDDPLSGKKKQDSDAEDYVPVSLESFVDSVNMILSFKEDLCLSFCSFLGLFSSRVVAKEKA